MPDARRLFRHGARRQHARGRSDPDDGRLTRFTALDRAIADRHVADLERAGAACRHVAGETEGHDAYVIVLGSREVFTLTRRGARIFNDVATPDGDVLPDRVGHVSIDLEFRAIRLVARIPDRSYGVEDDAPHGP